MNFFRVDGGRLTYSEYWRLAPGWLAFLVAAIRKFLGVPFRFDFAIPRPDRLFIVALDELPDAARRALAPAIAAAEAAGLTLAFCHRLVVPEPSRLGAAALLIDPAQTTGLMIVFGQQNRQQELHLSCGSRLTNDALAATTTMKATLNPIPGQSIERYPGADPVTLYRYHREHLARLDAEGLTPTRISRFEEFVLDCEVRYVDHHIARGVFVPMTDEELDAAAERV